MGNQKHRDYDEAISHYQQALAIREQVFGREHPKTQKTGKALTQLLQDTPISAPEQ